MEHKCNICNNTRDLEKHHIKPRVLGGAIHTIGHLKGSNNFTEVIDKYKCVK